MNIQIAYNIKRLREQQGWTQQQLADKLQLSRSVIAKWENSHVTPDISSLMKLSDLFHVSIDYLAGNNTFHENVIAELKHVFQTSDQSFDDEAVEIMEYVMTFPEIKERLFQLKQLTPKKQHSIHELLGAIIQQYKQL
ncbi:MULTISPECIES: helix-turn-helix domain-containing protein [Virgibacillus]|uniref:HTH-type transcriptional regulator ImmR n=1 Tax=Virgibacillus dokdonensis TaxID=302167 RepID=A0A2K9J324_9BACI|nr:MULTISPECIES: helix-turn-helix transcriptional regulator [Virgibacillus]AUJ25443.1 HTH-type transcriptional regulator ImmR [Virgibacillus dokdonensis]NWO13135.1 helix-turn-helix transcriptional regulator [Virgibacillus sp.]